MGRPLDVPELRRIYGHAVPHVQAFMVWAVGTGVRPEAVLELHSCQINFEDGLEEDQIHPGANRWRKNIARWW